VKIENFNNLSSDIGILGRYKRDSRKETNVRIDKELYSYVKKSIVGAHPTGKMSKFINQLIIDHVYAENIKKLFLGDIILFHLNVFNAASTRGLIKKYGLETMEHTAADKNQFKTRQISFKNIEKDFTNIVKVRFGKIGKAKKLLIIKIIFDMCEEALILTNSPNRTYKETVTWKSDKLVKKVNSKGGNGVAINNRLYNKWNFTSDIESSFASPLKLRVNKKTTDNKKLNQLPTGLK
jgi:hypothetical protein